MSHRHDLFTLVHKAIRVRLFETIRRLGGADFARDPEAPAAIAYLRETIVMLREHAGLEDRRVFPLLAARVPEVASQLGADHARDHALFGAIEHLTAELERAPLGARAALGQQLYRAFVDFAIDSLRHMRDEETRAAPALWAHYSDAELAAATARLQADLSPERSAVWLAHMLPAMTLGERIQLLGGIRAAAPAPVFARIAAVSAQALGVDGWAEVEREMR